MAVAETLKSLTIYLFCKVYKIKVLLNRGSPSSTMFMSPVEMDSFNGARTWRLSRNIGWWHSVAARVDNFMRYDQETRKWEMTKTLLSFRTTRYMLYIRDLLTEN